MAGNGGLTIEVISPDLQKQLDKLKEYPKIQDEELKKGMREARHMTWRSVHSLATRYHGHTESAIASQQTTEGPGSVRGWIGLAGKAKGLAVITATGRAPGKAPNSESLRPFVEDVMGIPVDESKHVAWLLAQKIAAKGTKGTNFIERGFEKVKGRLDVIWKKIADAITDRLAIGG